MPSTSTKFRIPSAECVERGAKYLDQIDRGGRGRSGKIYDERRVLLWRYDVRENPQGSSSGNPFNKPQFILVDPNGQPACVIQRVSFLPSIFAIKDEKNVVGRIRMRSLLRIRYAVEIHQAGSWTFRLPLFTVRFRGDSQASTDIWVIVGPSKREWNILLRPGIDNRHLLAALIFIHNEWWNYS